jgi:DNA-binding HxlR family transcriptional regulator
MRTYGQYCPIARAADLLAERWSIIILRNVLLGCRTFNEIADGAPGLSRGLLSKRLRELQRAGVVEIRPKPDGPGSLYGPTPAGRELSEVMLALQHWGSRWATLTPENAHPGVVLWGWVTFSLDRDHLPRRRLAADRPWRRRDLREVRGRRGGADRRRARSRGVRPLAPRGDRVG